MDRLLDINIKILTLLIILSVLHSSCSINNYDYKHIECQEVPQEAINIVIADYSKRLRKRKDINDVKAVMLYIDYTSTDWFYIGTKPWIPSLDDNGNYRINADKFPIERIDKYMGENQPYGFIPTQYAEKDNVLYVWYDPQAVLTEGVKNVLIKYDLVYYPGDLMIATTDGGDLSYIFCKTNYKRRYYRRIKAPYNTPLPSCNCH